MPERFARPGVGRAFRQTLGRSGAASVSFLSHLAAVEPPIGAHWCFSESVGIDRLIEIVERTGVEVSLDRERLAVLTQYAVPMRYDELLDAESLEREVLVVLVDEVAEWVDVQLGPAGE